MENFSHVSPGKQLWQSYATQPKIEILTVTELEFLQNFCQDIFTLPSPHLISSQLLTICSSAYRAIPLIFWPCVVRIKQQTEIFPHLVQWEYEFKTISLLAHFQWYIRWRGLSLQNICWWLGFFCVFFSCVFFFRSEVGFLGSYVAEFPMPM